MCPGRRAGAGLADQSLGSLEDLVVALVDAAIDLLGAEHAAPLCFFAFFESPLQFLLGQVDPELEDQRTVVDELLLETPDVVDAALELGVVDLAPSGDR